MAKKMLFIYNPFSGKARMKMELSDVLSLFVSNGWEVTVHPTQRPAEAIDLVEQCARAYDLVVCSGGDGTIDEVVEGMLRGGHQVPIGYIPTGTVNDFASSLGIPKEIGAAAAAIMDAEPYACDVGIFNDRHFNYVAAFGLFTEVAYSTPQETKNVLGKTAYVLEGAKNLLNLHTYHLRIEVDGQVAEGDYLYGAVSNSYSVAGLPVPVKRVDMADGVLEGLFIRMPEPFKLIPLLESLANGDPDPATVDVLRGKHWHIEADHALDWTLDGEFGGSVRDVIIGVEPSAIRMMVPKERLREEPLQEELVIAPQRIE